MLKTRQRSVSPGSASEACRGHHKARLHLIEQQTLAAITHIVFTDFYRHQKITIVWDGGWELELRFQKGPEPEPELLKGVPNRPLHEPAKVEPKSQPRSWNVGEAWESGMYVKEIDSQEVQLAQESLLVCEAEELEGQVCPSKPLESRRFHHKYRYRTTKFSVYVARYGSGFELIFFFFFF